MALTVLLTVAANAQQAVAHFDMSLKDGSISELTTGTHYAVASALPAFTVQGIDGEALRFDGYSNYVKASLPVGSLSQTALTVSVVLAAETYPMMQTDVAETTPTYTAICGNIDEGGKRGFAFELSSQGDVRFRFGSASGFLLSVEGSRKLPRGEWCQLTATLDKAGNAATLYLNGTQIGTARMSRQDIAHSTTDFYIGKSAGDKREGPFLVNTFCGLIDDIAVYNGVAPGPPAGGELAVRPDFSYPAARYEASLWRPRFHGMPSGGWTNETHGMMYSGGRYHLFFQKNANGPYMSRLHWGHISSANLCDWRDEPIAVAPGADYDLKGCWSGCIYDADDGTPTILYTAVDNQKATIAQAKALDDGLAAWEKQGIVINGRPAGLSDDFRDPYYFEANGRKYIIVGTSKNGLGACTLHEYQDGQWTNDGTIFFQGSTASQHGTFWEMPNVTPMGNDKYLFTCTPLGTAAGVRTLCWVGTIGTDGTFAPIGGQAGGLQYLEMGGISRDGYGLLSPTILTSDLSPLTSPLLIGIVPDKLPTQTNYEMGWAHNYSLPREIALDADGALVQKPYSGLTALRSATAVSTTLTAAATAQLAPVGGRQLEPLGDFDITTGTCGFSFLKSGTGEARLTYDADRGTLTLDLTALQRLPNDGGSYNGIYTAAVPGRLTRLHVYLDGSILDIFVNDRWAYCVRLFPTDGSATEAEVFTTAPGTARVQAWTLDARQPVGIRPVGGPQSAVDHAVYDLQGRRVGQPRSGGLYICNGKKYVAR